LVDAFEKGVVTLNSSDGAFCLKPLGMVHLEVEAVSKKDKEKFGLKFSWKKEVIVPSGVEKEFFISSDETVEQESTESQTIVDNSAIEEAHETEAETTNIEEGNCEPAEDHKFKKSKTKK